MNGEVKVVRFLPAREKCVTDLESKSRCGGNVSKIEKIRAQRESWREFELSKYRSDDVKKLQLYSKDEVQTPIPSRPEAISSINNDLEFFRPIRMLII